MWFQGEILSSIFSWLHAWIEFFVALVFAKRTFTRLLVHKPAVPALALVLLKTPPAEGVPTVLLPCYFFHKFVARGSL